MRREQKKQAEDFVKLLGQAHEEIKKDIERKHMELARDMLAQCQEGAIQLGNLVEATEGGQQRATDPLDWRCRWLGVALRMPGNYPARAASVLNH